MLKSSNGKLGHRTYGPTAEFGVEPQLDTWLIRCDEHGSVHFVHAERVARQTPTAEFCAGCADRPDWKPPVEEAGRQYRQARDVAEQAKQRLRAAVLEAKTAGAGDRALAHIAGISEMTVREWRGVRQRQGGKIISN